MAKSKKSQTKQQWGVGAGANGVGAHGLPYPVKSEQGVLLLPPGASSFGSGAFEGRNPYSHTWNGSGFGAGITGIGAGILGQYPIPLPGTIATYRQMLRHDVIALSAMLKTSTIIAGRWGYEKVNDDAPDDAVTLIQNVFEPRRTQLVMDLTRALWFGFADVEQVWGTDRDGAFVPTRFKSLLQDITTVQIDEFGDIAWLNNTGQQLTPESFIHFCWNKEGSNWYGESRLENCRRTWANYLADEDQLYRLNQKAAGILVEVGFPPDYSSTGTAPAVGESNKERAMVLAHAITAGRSVVFENMTGITPDDLVRAPDLADKTLWKITKHDMGNTGPSQMALIESLKYKDAKLARGILVPERSLIEASTAGSRADSESHGSINDADADTIHSLLCGVINEQSVDAILLQNFGPKAVGTVRIKPKEIIDENRLVDEKLLDAAVKDPSILHALFESMDVQEWATRNGIKLKEGATIEIDDPDADESKMDAESKAELSATLSRAWSERSIA